MAQFNFTYEPGITFEQMLGFEVAGRLLSQHLKDSITTNLHVAFTKNLPEGVIGGAVPVIVTTDVGNVQIALAQDVTSTDDVVASSHLNVAISENGTLEYTAEYNQEAYQGDRLTLTQANAKALGIVGDDDATPLDGYILLSTLENTPYDWDTDYGRTGATDGNSLDLLSVILHELGHVLGFVSGVDSLDGVPGNDLGTDPGIDRLSALSLLDLYRYSAESSAQNAQEITPGADAYFSIDGGDTAIASFSSGVVEVLGGIEGYQASHWANNGLDPAAADSDTTDTRQQTTDFVAALFEQATPATLDDYVPELFDLLVDPTVGTSIFEGLSSNVEIDTDKGNSLGIMDPALAPGERSDLSALDRQALDVLGYDTVSVTAPVNYGALLEDAVSDLVSRLELEDLIQAGVIQVQDLVDFDVVQPQAIDEFSQIQASPIPGNDVQSDDVTVQGLIDGGVVTIAVINQAFVSVEYLLNTNWITVDDIIGLHLTDGSSVERDRSQSFLDALADNAELYERRRKRRRRVKASLWQEDDLDLTTVNILSDGAGETAQLLVDGSVSEANDLITIVQANAPDAPLVLRTINLQGTDANDLIIPTYDVFQSIDAGDGNNVVQLGNNGGIVIAGDGSDTVLSLDGDVRVAVGAGDNVVLLAGGGDGSASHTITTHTGDDYIVSTGSDFVAISASAGDDIIDAAGANVFAYAGSGNNVVKIQASYDADVYAGSDNDQLQIRSSKTATVATGDGTDLIILGDRTGSYYAHSGLSDVITITDFANTDQLQLYGTPQDYTIVENELFYQGDLLARFTTGIHFTLASSQLSFVDESTPTALDRSVVIPTVAETLTAVDAQYTRASTLKYRIVGGDDALLFSIDATTGELRFVIYPTANAEYQVIVQAEANGHTDTQLLTIHFSEPNPAGGSTQLVTLTANPINDTLDTGSVESAAPDIDIESFVNGLGSPTSKTLPGIAAGEDIAFTHTITNTGKVNVHRRDIAVIDDHGTPDDDSDDVVPSLVLASDVGRDNILSIGETWTYQSSTFVAQNLNTVISKDVEFTLTGNSFSNGTNGNSLSFENSTVSVDVSAFSKKDGDWSTAHVGAYSRGLGIANSAEGDRDLDVDNSDHVNYLLFEFDQSVVVNKAFLDSVDDDSDLSIWIGDRNGDISQLNDTLLNRFHHETNTTKSDSSRWADFNPNEHAGDTVIIAARIDQDNDEFKVQKLSITALEDIIIGTHERTATVTANGVSDSDISGYKNPAKASDDSVITQVNQSTTIDVLANDINAETVDLRIADTPIDGTVDIINNQVVYTPNPGFFGVDKFDYTFSEGNGDLNKASVLVNVRKTEVDIAIDTSAVGLYDGKRNSDELDHGVTLRQEITVTNHSDETATGLVVGTTLQAGLDVWEPDQPTVSEYGFTWVNSQGADNDERFQGNPETVDPTNGIVTVNDVTLANTPSAILNSNDVSQGELIWELGAPLDAGESATLTFYAQRSDFGRTDPFVGDDVFFQHTVSLRAVDQHDPNSRNNYDETYLSYDSPIAFDLNGNGIQTLNLNKGVMFDMGNTGTAVNTGWLSGEDGFLAVDTDGDDLISSRAELFGGAVGEGFAKLASFDSNGDGLVNESDAQFGKLKLWQDVNENGVTDQGELVSLESTGITDLDTSYTNVFSIDDQGNIHGEHSSATRKGRRIGMVDVYFQVEN